MKTIELTGHVDEQHRLSAAVPESLKPGPVKVVLFVPDDVEGAAEVAWLDRISQDWVADWSDPREDIYTPEDGEPLDEPR